MTRAISHSPPYNWNNIGSDYGFFDKDLNRKPLAEENLRLQSLLRYTNGTLKSYKRNCVIVAPREEDGKQYDMLRAAYMLCERVGLDAGFAYAVDPIPDADLYIMPSQQLNKSVTNVRLQEILARVEAGATLYLSVGKALFRRLSALGGVVIENRMDCGRENAMVFPDGVLPIYTPVQYTVMEDGCQVLARDDGGQPIFVKNRFGKGTVYVLLAPLEQYLADKPGAFFMEDTPDYERIYRELAGCVPCTRIADCPSKFIRLTEHEAENGDKYLFAINYHNCPQSAELQISDAYDLRAVWGHSLAGKRISLAPCDGILIQATKKKNGVRA